MSASSCPALGPYRRVGVGGLGGQLHRVARPRSDSLRPGEARLAEHEPRTVVLRDTHLHVSSSRAITGDGVRQRHPSVRSSSSAAVTVTVCATSQLVEVKVSVVLSGVRSVPAGTDGHVARRPGAQDDDVRVGSTLRYRQSLRQFAHPDLEGRLLTGNTHYRDDHRLRGDRTVVRPRNGIGVTFPCGGVLSSAVTVCAVSQLSTVKVSVVLSGVTASGDGHGDVARRLGGQRRGVLVAPSRQLRSSVTPGVSSSVNRQGVRDP